MTEATAVSHELASAARHDSQGEHAQAIDCLARAAQAGSNEALTQLARRLIAGDRAPTMPREGARLLLDAARAGGAEAAAALAVLLALGAYVPQNMGAAFDTLGFAAERGSRSARQQLSLLLPSHPLTLEAQRSDTPSASLWRRLATEAAQTEARWSASVSAPWSGCPVYPVHRVIAPALCDWLVGRSQGRLTRARVYDSDADTDLVHPTRANTAAAFNLVEAEFLHILVQSRMARVCGVPVLNLEPLTVLHYALGEQVRNHYDFVDPQARHYTTELERNGQRRLTFLIYLNDDYTGGETDFPQLGIRFKGDKGTGLFFVNAGEDDRPDQRMLHAGLPPATGEKWIVSQFVRSRPTIPPTGDGGSASVRAS